ncbi:helix-turn-helix transcriptional regulator, partial [Acinetobacter baumannii]
MAQVLGLTQAEARLLKGLVEGLSLAEYAATAELSVLTVRSQMKAVFAKTGARRQSELMRLVLTSSILARPLQSNDTRPD